MHTVKAYLGFIVTYLVIDAVWILTVVRPLYYRDLSHLLAESPDMLAAIIFYLAYPFGVVIFVIKPAVSKVNVLTLGSLFGLITYGTYTLTNYALLKGWTVTILLSDAAWGAFITSVSAFAGYLAANYKISSEKAFSD